MILGLRKIALFFVCLHINCFASELEKWIENLGSENAFVVKAAAESIANSGNGEKRVILALIRAYKHVQELSAGMVPASDSIVSALVRVAPNDERVYEFLFRESGELGIGNSLEEAQRALMKLSEAESFLRKKLANNKHVVVDTALAVLTSMNKIQKSDIPLLKKIIHARGTLTRDGYSYLSDAVRQLGAEADPLVDEIVAHLSSNKLINRFKQGGGTLDFGVMFGERPNLNRLMDWTLGLSELVREIRPGETRHLEALSKIQQILYSKGQEALAKNLGDRLTSYRGNSPSD